LPNTEKKAHSIGGAQTWAKMKRVVDGKSDLSVDATAGTLVLKQAPSSPEEQRSGVSVVLSADLEFPAEPVVATKCRKVFTVATGEMTSDCTCQDRSGTTTCTGNAQGDGNCCRPLSPTRVGFEAGLLAAACPEACVALDAESYRNCHALF
jgi:hypothetical protein